jgi:hypothetical protein
VTRRATTLVACALALIAAGALYERHAAHARRAAHAASSLAEAIARGDVVLRVPRAPGAVTLDGDTDDPGWVRPPGPAKTGPLLTDTGDPAVPYSQARLVWGDGYLYMALFASDEDVETHVTRNDADVGRDDDDFHVVFTREDTAYAFDFSPTALVTDAVRHGTGPWDRGWNGGAHVSKELGGTPNAPNNLDEEWELEIAIPLSSLGLAGEPGENVGFSLHRCDTPKDAKRVCAGWGDGQDGRRSARIVLQ